MDTDCFSQRRAESHAKVAAGVKELSPKYGDVMMQLSALATHPSKQGLGFGTILCTMVTTEVRRKIIFHVVPFLIVSQADRRCLPTYLVSSNVKANTGFYNSLGFFTVKELSLGDDNPTWKEPPVVVAVVCVCMPWLIGFTDVLSFQMVRESSNREIVEGKV